MNITNYKVADLRPYDKNPRINDDAVELVANSIREFGFKQPIVIDKNRVIIAGHTRWKAAKKLGLNEVPCILADDLTPAQVKAYRLADNKVAEASEWDEELLAGELDDLSLDFDMSGLGFDTEEMPAEDLVDDNYEPDVPGDPMTRTGQIWALGQHRLMVGDSTSADDVETLCDSEMMDLCVTDPPYNVDYTGKTSKALKIENDQMTPDQFLDFLTDAFENMEHSLRAGGAFYVWHASRAHMQFEQALNNVGLEVREQLIWNKNALVLGRQDYQWKHEPCLYGWKGGAPHYFINTRTLTSVLEPEGGVSGPRQTEERRSQAALIYGAVELSGGDRNRREETGKERPASYNEADPAHWQAGAEQLRVRRQGTGPFRGLRFYADRLRAAKQAMLHDGIRSAVCGRNYRPVGTANRRKGGAFEWLMA